MKKILIFFIFFIVFKNANSQLVYICTGQYSEAYHFSLKCRGLNNCKSQVEQVAVNYAVAIKNRRPCCICVSQYGCIEDQNDIIKFNPYVPQGGGGSSSGGGVSPEAAGYVAAGILGIGAAIYSNDFYIQFIHANSERNYNNTEIGNNNGLAFGFRSVNNKSVLEYGASLIGDNSTSVRTEGGYFFQTTITDTKKYKWGGHLNYLHNLSLIKNKNKFDFFIGATINSFFSKNEPIGIGAIVGMNLKILNWLKFDTRYERSTTTNRIVSGIIIKYN